MFYLAAFIAAATINFFLPRLMPGDPIQKMFAGAGSNLSLENLNALKLTFGFIDAPLGEQYLGLPRRACSPAISAARSGSSRCP